MIEEIVRHIETEGYYKIPQLYSPEQVETARNMAIEWHKKTKDTLGANLPALAKDDPFVWNLQNKDYYFLEMLFGSPVIQEILMHFLNDTWFKQIPPNEPNYILRSFMARSSSKTLPMHIDSLVPYRGSNVFVMQVSIIMEDQNEANGCTVVVPGSQSSGEYVSQSAFKDAIPIMSKAGDVVIWDSRIWHGTGENTSGGTRWAMIATYTRWWIKQMFKITERMPQEIYARLTDNQKAVMGFCSIPYGDETEGVDMKRGYDSLLSNAAGYRS